MEKIWKMSGVEWEEKNTWIWFWYDMKFVLCMDTGKIYSWGKRCETHWSFCYEIKQYALKNDAKLFGFAGITTVQRPIIC